MLPPTTIKRANMVQREHLAAFLAIVVAFPVQYYLQNNFSLSQVRNASIKWPDGKPQRRTQDMSRFYSYLSAWRRWYDEMGEWIEEVLPVGSFDDEGFYAGDEVEDYAGEGGQRIQVGLSSVNGVINVTTHGWFGSSTKARRIHPQTIKYKVGDVVRYRDFGLTCAVVAWDKVLRAPEEWVKLVYGEDADYFSEQPHYTLVCDARDVEVEEEEVQYVSQGELVRVEDKTTRVISPYIDQFFEGFNDRTGRYIMRRWLKRIYPKDH